MNYKFTRYWIVAAMVLLAFIVLVQRRGRKPLPGPPRPLPTLEASTVTSVLVTTQGQVIARATLTNKSWHLSEPIADLANGPAIEFLAHAVEKITAALYIPASELHEPARTSEDYGFSPEGYALFFEQGSRHLPQLKVGRRTNPGDQVFLQVAGDPGIYVVDSSWLDFVPKVANAWRDPTVVNLRTLTFDRIGVTNHGAFFSVQRDANQVWRMDFPGGYRADNPRIQAGMLSLHQLRALEYVPERPKLELEPLGLAPPELEIGFSQGTNSAAVLQFGKTNEAGQVYARRVGRNAILTVPTAMLAIWQRAAVNDFRDHRLLTLGAAVQAVEIRGEDSFSIQRQPKGEWRVLPQNFPADSGLVGDLLSGLTNMMILDFYDVVTEPALPKYGLASPERQVRLFGPGFRADGTNALMANVLFGRSTNHEGMVFARRSDEESVYSIITNEYARLPGSSWQMRERRLWTFSTNDIAGVTIHHLGKTWRMVRRGPYKWSVGEGSQGMINNELAVEETTRGLAEAEAAVWSARGAQNRERLGFKPDGHEIVFELKNGEKAAIEFGGEAPSGLPYAAVTLEKECWIFEFPPVLYRDVLGCLTIPANVR